MGSSRNGTVNTDKAILNVEEAAALLGVSIKTFNKVLHQERVPARKIGREWKFSRQALIDWVGRGDSAAFYKPERGNHDLVEVFDDGTRRTSGWKMKKD